jgi:hypothetical protein
VGTRSMGRRVDWCLGLPVSKSISTSFDAEGHTGKGEDDSSYLHQLDASKRRKNDDSFKASSWTDSSDHIFMERSSPVTKR